MNIAVAPGTQTFAVQALDSKNVLLSDGTSAPTVITMNAANQIALTLNGDVAAVTFVPVTVPACAATTAPLKIVANDADGQQIAGTYSTPVTLAATGPAPRGTATPNASVSPAAVSASTATAPTLTFDGKSPGATTITAFVGKTAVGSYTFAPTPKVCAEYALTTTSSGPRGIVAGSDGNVWFTEFQGHNVGRVSPTTSTTLPVGTVAEFSTVGGTGFAIQSSPNQIASGPDGNLWFTDPFNGVTTFAPGTPVSQTVYPADATNGETSESPQGIVAGPAPGGMSSLLWYLQSGTNTIQTITTGGTIGGNYSVPTSNAGLFGIALGPDSNIWFTENLQNKVGAIATSGKAGTITEYALPTSGAQPTFITGGPDGALWFTETGANQIGRIRTGGSITEFPLPSGASTKSQGPQGIVTGLDGNLYFCENTSSSFGQISTSGAVYEFPTLASSAAPYAIAVGPDNNLWFTERTANNVGYIGY